MGFSPISVTTDKVAKIQLYINTIPDRIRVLLATIGCGLLSEASVAPDEHVSMHPALPIGTFIRLAIGIPVTNTHF